MRVSNMYYLLMESKDYKPEYNEYQEDLEDELYNILAWERDKLTNFLNKYGSFKTLSEIIKQMEIKYLNKHPNINLLRELLLGNIGYEHNKQHAIYVLPTHEQIKLIIGLCKMFNIRKVNDIMAGIGLLGKILMDNWEFDSVISYDDNSWLDTYGSAKYSPINQKNIADVKVNDDELNIISWCEKDSNTLRKLETFMIKQKPKYLLLIDEAKDINEMCGKFITMVENKGYSCIEIPCKNICYKDYFSVDTLGKYIHSKTYLFINKIKVPIYEDITLKCIVDKCGDILYENKLEWTKKHILLDMIIEGVVPHFCKDKLITDYTFICKTIYSFISAKYKIPEYIENYEEFEFSVVNGMKNIMKIKTRDKFLGYYKLITMLNEVSGISKLRQLRVFPLHLTNKHDIARYILKDYTTTDKRWKI